MALPFVLNEQGFEKSWKVGAGMRYVGIDLAWGERNTTAVAVLQGQDDPKAGAKLIAFAPALLSDADVLGFCAEHDDGGRYVVGIDAPLLVPNQTGRRPCEATLSRCLRSYEAGPHPANRTLIAQSDGTIRGERLAQAFVQRDIPHTPYLNTLSTPPRAVFEVFPHPAHVVLFDLAKTLKYKARPDRTRDNRIGEMRRYIAYLSDLQTAVPSLTLPPDLWNPLATIEGTIKGTDLKIREDVLDAITCAYITLHRTRFGDEKSAVVGDLKEGYIVTPVTDALRHCFAKPD